MATESKKLQTIVTLDSLKWESTLGAKNLLQALSHDARIAHEQREVLRSIVKAADTDGCSCTACTLKRDAAMAVALAAAAPFLED